MGGGGKGGTTTQTVSIPPEVLARYNAVNARAEGLADTPFQPYSNDPNAFVAPLTSTQQAGISNTNQAAGMAQPYYNAATGMTMAGSQSIGQLTPEQINKYQNPYTQAVADTTFQNLRQQQAQEMQGATGNAIRAGAFGGDRSGLVAANMARQQQQGTAAAMAPIYQQGYQNAVQTAQGQQAVTAADLARLQQGGQQVANLGAGAQGAALQGAGAQLSAGQMQQQTNQAGKAALYNQFLQQQGYPFQIAQFLANIAMGTGALSGSTTQTQAPGGFFSDERLKENIKKIGETNDGQNIYKYNYKGEPRTQIGLIAQDVEKSHPDAVGQQQGYKTVDYDKATENSEGGAVHQFNAREGFDLGGSAAFDPNMVKELLRRQVEMYGQQSAPGGGKTPGQAGYMPAAPALPANIGLARPAAPPAQQQSGLAQAAQTGRNISEGLGMAEGAKTKLFGGTDAKGKPVAGFLDRSDEANALRAAQEAAEKKAYEEAIKSAHGGLIVGRHHYALGGMPYGDADATQKGYMGQLSLETPSPTALKNEQDSMRAGKMPDNKGGGLGEAVGTASKLYGGTKMASAAYDKAAALLDPKIGTATMTGANGAPVASAAEVGPFMSEAPASVTSGLGAAATPAVETAAAAAPIAEGVAAAAPVAEGLAAAAPVAEAGASIAELLPLLLLKRGGVAGREHHDGSEGNVVGESATPEFDRLKKQRLEAEAAATAAPVEAPAPASAPVKANIFEGLNPSSRAAVNNNPGNIIDSPFAKTQPGYLGSDGKFAKFESPEHGETAMHNLLSDYQKRGFNTPSSIIGRWAPPSDNNDTASYVAQVAKKLGVGPNDPIDVSDPNVRSVLGKAIATVEAGTAQSGSGQKGQAPSQPAAEKSALGAAKQSISDAGDYYTKNREHIIPVIAGLGSMLASNRPNLGQALGEGLVGYSTSAADMMKRAADTGLVKAATTAREFETTRANVFTNPDGITRVAYVDPKTGKTVVRKASEYFALPETERPSLNPDDYAKVKEAAAKEAGGLGAAAPAGAPATAPAGTPAPATGLAPAAPPAPTGTMVIEPNAAAKTAAAQEVKDLEAIDIGANRDAVIKQNLDILNVAKNRQANAIEMTQGLNDITKPLVTLAAGQQIAPGAYAKILGTVADKWNSAVSQLNLPNEAKIAAGAVDQLQMADKASAVLREAKARGMDQRALGALEALERGLADPSKTKEAAAEILAGSYIDKQRMLEEAIYTQKYGQGQGMTVAKNAPLAFKQQYPDENYNKDKLALKDLMLASIPTDPKNPDGPREPLLNYAMGIGKNAELQRQMKESGVINQKYGTNVTRYFNNSVK